MKIITWNVNSLRVRLEQLVSFIEAERPDVVALQEIKLADQDFPLDALTSLGYAVSFAGQQKYNGVALLTRGLACSDVIKDLPDFTDEQRRVLAGTWGEYRIINLYVPNGGELTSDKYQYKLNWLAACQKFVKQQLEQFQKVIVVGDFNIAPTDQDVYDAQVWQNCVLVSEPERAAFRELLALGLVDTFRSLDPEGIAFSWWDYRAAAFRRNLGLRIDHILVNSTLASQCQKCWIAKDIRKLERPSDHAPVVAEFQ